ncbi:MAG: amidohydrolase family protein [Chloroflexota bacterium]
MIIDFSAHHISKRVGKYISRAKWYGPGTIMDFPQQNADPEVRLALMEKYGVDMQALTQTAPVIVGFKPDEAAEICRLSNDDNYALCKAYPKKFVNICFFSLQDMKSAMKELERAVKELDCRAITLGSNQAGKGLDFAEFYPFYEKVVEYDLPIFIHPVQWESYPLVDAHKGWKNMLVLGWPFDTTQAAWRLVLSGTIDRSPGLKVVLHHYGAMLPFFSRRIEQNIRMSLKDRLKPGKDITEYWKSFYGDTALDGAVASYPVGYAFFGPDRTVFGTDYPFGAESGEDFYRENLKGVQAMKIPAKDMKKVLGENAKRLLKIK